MAHRHRAASPVVGLPRILAGCLCIAGTLCWLSKQAIATSQAAAFSWPSLRSSRPGSRRTALRARGGAAASGKPVLTLTPVGGGDVITVSGEKLELPGCVIEPKGGAFMCRDLGGEETSIDDNSLAPDVSYLLGTGQQVQLGGASGTVYEVSVAGGYAGDATSKMMFEAMKAQFEMPFETGDAEE
mmetsp:Transcript_7707/g.20770  ORF Transcript_7707/g.20770 Transcript_7707/m.20770 type:complete len:185 (+) Transcript_7707:60-614(+)